MKSSYTPIRIDKNQIPFNTKELRLYSVIRNERPRMRFFIEYYKKMGVDRFFFIDNFSTDKIEEELLSYQNVHVYKSTLNFYQTRVIHLKKLVQKYSNGSWCLLVDPDEFLRFPFDNILNLKSLIIYLEGKKAFGFKTLLLDMYSNKKIKETCLTSKKTPFQVCEYFDRKGYVLLDEMMYGGVRSRVFGLDEVCLTKYPLFKNIPLLRQKFSNVHENPGITDTSTTGILFHFKFFDLFIKKAPEEAKREEHWKKSLEYKIYIKKKLSDLNLYSDHYSIKFINLYQLYKLKLLKIDISFLLFVFRWKILMNK